MKSPQTTTKLLLATIVAGLAVLAAGTGAASAAPAAQLQSTNKCWLDVVNDWLRNQPNLKGTYAIPCYTQAIQHLSAYSDVAGYSSASDDIHRALLAVIHNEGRGGDGGGGGPTANITPPGPGSSSNGGGTPHKSLWQDITDRLAPGNAQSIPLPLIVLAGLAVLLLLAAAGTWFARRMQTRRVAPAPAPVPRR